VTWLLLPPSQYLAFLLADNLMFGLLTHEEPNILHGFKLWLHYKPLYCGKMQSMWSKLQLRCHCEDLKILYVVAAIAVADHNLKEYVAAFLWS